MSFAHLMRRPINLKVALAALSLLTLAGCSGEPKTVLSHSQGFSLTVPPEFILDVTLNANTETTSTWFRKDGQALIAVDLQPLAGTRRDKLIETGKRAYLDILSRELETDLGTHLKGFKDFESHVIDLGPETAMEATFETDHLGDPQRAFILMAVSATDPPMEIMVDYRLPESEADDDQVWIALLKSVKWTKAEASPTPAVTATPGHSATPTAKASPAVAKGH